MSMNLVWKHGVFYVLLESFALQIQRACDMDNKVRAIELLKELRHACDEGIASLVD